MSDTTASPRRKNGSAGNLQSVVCNTKASAARCEFCGHIEKPAGWRRWKSRDLAVLKESIPVQRPTYRRHQRVLWAVTFGLVYGVLASTVMAQEPAWRAHPLKDRMDFLRLASSIPTSEEQAHEPI